MHGGLSRAFIPFVRSAANCGSQRGDARWTMAHGLRPGRNEEICKPMNGSHGFSSSNIRHSEMPRVGLVTAFAPQIEALLTERIADVLSEWRARQGSNLRPAD